jgi:arylsulfatase A-like enzyme
MVEGIFSMILYTATAIRLLITRVIVSTLVLLLSGCGYFQHKPIPIPEKKPINFIVILLDDLGLHDLGVTGNDFIETPAIDQLAHDGTLFTHAYSTPNCAPSRAELMSGQYATRTGVYTMMTGEMGDAAKRKVVPPPNRVYLPEKVYTLAEMLHDNGYTTAHIGKWNLGTGSVRGPTGQGFDINIGGYRGGAGETGGIYFAPYSTHLPGLQLAPQGEYLTDRLNQEAVDFIEKNSDKPFFLYVSHFAPHFPILAPQETREKYEAKRDVKCGATPVLKMCDMSDVYPEYAAMIEHIDRGVAQIREMLIKEKLAENTVIVLMSDNGGYALASDPDALRGNKSQLYEGGIRVPMIWFVPGSVSAGKAVDTPVTLLDIYPTFAAMVGDIRVAPLLDGTDLSGIFSSRLFPLLLMDDDSAKKYTDRALFWYLPGYTVDTDADEVDFTVTKTGKFSQIPAAVIQRDDWKLIRYYDGTEPELYHLVSDAMETNNLYRDQPVQAVTLMAELENWLRNTGGLLSLPANPAYKGGR